MNRVKIIYRRLFFFSAFAFLMACSSPPEVDFALARQAIDTVVSDGAEIYTPEDLDRISRKLGEAVREIQRQDALIFRDYRLAAFTLEQVVAEAEVLQGKLARRKLELNIAADTAFRDARAAVGQSRGMYATVLRERGECPALESVRNDLEDLEIDLKQIQKEIAAGEYLRASKKAVAVTDRVLILSDVIRLAKSDQAELEK